MGSVRQNVEAAGTVAGSGAEKLFETRFQEEQDRFDMFARAEAVDAKIDAIAIELSLPDVAHLDLVGQAAGGFDGEIRKNGMRGVEIEDLERLRARPEAAAVDLILIGRAPVVEGRRLK
ncbi:MAG TPA: hypothetical protein VK731_07790, partial [Candidatus Cybelea sp.]|nr:hypothetical protein [Candidatus Cybelea sp.]